MFTGVKLLADLLDWKVEEVEKALQYKDAYTRIERRKKGKVRIVYAPHEELKKLQRAILHRIIERYPLGDEERFFYGSVKNRGWVDNAMLHAQARAPYVLRLDLEDAFPSVTREYLREKLGLLLDEELLAIKRGENPAPTRFPSKRVSWFRKLLRAKEGERDLSSPSPSTIIKEFLELILDVVTYQGQMAQGIPTSSALLNLLIARSGVSARLYDTVIHQQELPLFGCTVSVYVDDFTISSQRPFTVALTLELIRTIERWLPHHKVNLKKILRFDRKKGSPLITGLRIGTKTICENGRTLEVPTVSLPKAEARRIRNRIHSWIGDPKQELRVRGYRDCLWGIYGKKKIPRQLWISIQNYQRSIGKTA